MTCSANVFANKTACFRCGSPKPLDGGVIVGGYSGGYGYGPSGDRHSGSGANGEKREGDWICSGCKATVFASKDVCFACRMPKGGGQIKGGSVYDPGRGMRGGRGRSRRNDDDGDDFGDFSNMRRRRREPSPDRRFERYDRGGDRYGGSDRHGRGGDRGGDRYGGGSDRRYDRGGDRGGDRGDDRGGGRDYDRGGGRDYDRGENGNREGSRDERGGDVRSRSDSRGR